MKRIVLLTLVLTAAVFTTNAQKLGHIDTQSLLTTMPAVLEAQAQIKKIQDDHIAVLTSLESEMKTKYEEYTSAPATTELQQQLRENELTTMQQNYQSYQESAQVELQEREATMMNPIYDEVQDAVKAVGAENGFIYIFDSSVGVILYDGGGEDIMSLVKTKLGMTE